MKVQILEGPEWERAPSLAKVPPAKWESWLLGHYGVRRGEDFKRNAKFLLDNLKVIEAGSAMDWLSLGCGTFEEVLTYFDLNPEQWVYLKAGESVLLPNDTVEVVIAKGKAKVQQVAAEAKPAPTREENPGGRGKTASIRSSLSAGTSAQYLTARIARDSPEVHERMKAGEFKSVRQAAIEAGIVKPETPVQVAVRAWKKMNKKQRAEFMKLIKDGSAE